MCLLLYSWGSDNARMKPMHQCVHVVLGTQKQQTVWLLLCASFSWHLDHHAWWQRPEADERPGALKSVTCLHYFISLLLKIIMLFVCACSHLRVIDSRISTLHNRFRTRGYIQLCSRLLALTLIRLHKKLCKECNYFGSGHWNEQFLNL